MIQFVCLKCKQDCETTEKSYEEPHEVWGAKVWVTVCETVSACCLADMDERELDDDTTRD